MVSDLEIVLIIGGIILLFIILFKKKPQKEITIFEDKRISPTGRVTSWWIGNKEFHDLNYARQFARRLKNE